MKSRSRPRRNRSLASRPPAIAAQDWPRPPVGPDAPPWACPPIRLPGWAVAPGAVEVANPVNVGLRPEACTSTSSWASCQMLTALISPSTIICTGRRAKCCTPKMVRSPQFLVKTLFVLRSRYCTGLIFAICPRYRDSGPEVFGLPLPSLILLPSLHVFHVAKGPSTPGLGLDAASPQVFLARIAIRGIEQKDRIVHQL